jgi:hypothetical protein
VQGEHPLPACQDHNRNSELYFSRKRFIWLQCAGTPVKSAAVRLLLLQGAAGLQLAMPAMKHTIDLGDFVATSAVSVIESVM